MPIGACGFIRLEHLHLQLRPQRGATFLLSSAMFWLDKYHADGLRVMLSLRCCISTIRERQRVDSEPIRWPRNSGGHRLPATANPTNYKEHPDVQTYAEESNRRGRWFPSPLPRGLGFGMKWDMGWMHDTLSYFSHNPIHRQYHHNLLTFRMLYGFTKICVAAVPRRSRAWQGLDCWENAWR
jgi:1,4-alpha-glucan branching enzyme